MYTMYTMYTSNAIASPPFVIVVPDFLQVVSRAYITSLGTDNLIPHLIFWLVVGLFVGLAAGILRNL